MVKRYLVLHGGSAQINSPYATTSAVDYRGVAFPQRPPASPWMGEPQSRHGYMSSGYQQSFYRDAHEGKLDGPTIAGRSFSRPKTTSLAEMQPWTGQKDETPIKSCLHRGELKEPRFYPFKMGSEHGAEVLVSPKEADASARFAAVTIAGKGPISPKAPVMKSRGTQVSGFSTGNDQAAVKGLITASQSDGIARTPALTMLGAERVAADSTRRYFHARDFYENPYVTSNDYYQSDTLAQHAEMKRKKESLTAVPSTRPLTQYALMHNDAPYAPDVGDGIGLPIPRVGEGVSESWGVCPPPEERVGLMPTGFSRLTGITAATGGTGDEPPPAPPLPERFARIRARHDYLRWGGEPVPGRETTGRYHTTSRVELCKPGAQQPLGGAFKLPLGAMVVPSDSSGYHMQISANPITPDPGC